MRFYILICFTLFTSNIYAQIGYECFNQSKHKANWEYLGPINTKSELAHQRFGIISCFSVNPNDSNEIFVGSPTGSLFQTKNRGVGWRCLTDQVDIPIIGINDIIIDYTKTPYEIIIATGSENEWFTTPNFGIFKSIDGGETWQQKKVHGITELFGPSYLKFVQYKNLIFCYSRNSILLSNSNGEDWNHLVNGETILNGLKLKERDIRYIYYEPTNNVLYFSTKQKWTSRGNENAKLYAYYMKNKSIKDLTLLLENKFATNKKDNGMEAIQILPYAENELLLSASHHSSGEMYVYQYNFDKNEIVEYEVPNGGTISGASLHWFSGFRINKKNSNIRYLAGVYLYKSTNGGQSYKPMFNYSYGDNNVPHVDIRSIEITHHSIDGESDHIYIGTDGGLSFSNDGGKSFRNLNGSVLELTQFYGVGSSPFNGTISAGSQDNSIISYIPEKKKWLYNVRGDGYDVAYSKTIPGRAYGQYNSRTMSATSNDLVPFSQPLRLAQENSSNRKTIVSHTNGNLYFGAQSLFVLPKGKSQWIEHKTILKHKALAIDVSHSNPDIIYMSGNWSDLIKSEDGGKSWKNISDKILVNEFLQTNRIQSICISPYDEDRVWIGFAGAGNYQTLCKETIRVIESRDGGKTWTDASRGLPIFAIHDLKFYEGSYESLFAATDQGVYFKRGTGYKWQRYSEKLPKCLIGELNLNYCRGKLITATYGRGLWETDLPPIEDKNPLIIRGKKTLTAPKGESLVINQDIIIRGKCKLIIDCPVYMPKGSKLRVKRKSQVQFTENGKIINGCGNEWQGIVVK